MKNEYKNVYTYLKAYYEFLQFNFNTSLSLTFWTSLSFSFFILSDLHNELKSDYWILFS